MKMQSKMAPRGSKSTSYYVLLAAATKGFFFGHEKASMWLHGESNGIWVLTKAAASIYSPSMPVAWCMNAALL